MRAATCLSLAVAAFPAFGAEPAIFLQPVLTTNYVVITNMVVVTNYVTVFNAAPSLRSLAFGLTNSRLPNLSWVPPEDSYDWIQLNTGEWLKGRIKAMQERQIEFFSEKLSDVTFDWKDIRQVRSPRTIDVSFVSGKKVSGPVTVTPEQVTVGGAHRLSFPGTSYKASRRGGPRSGITGRSTCQPG